MLKSAEVIFRRAVPVQLNKPQVCFTATAQTLPNTPERLRSFRTSESDPLKHSTDHLGRFYTVDESDKKTVFLHGGLPKSFEIQAKTFNETCLMVRRPALDVINCLRSIDYTKPAVRFVVYGKKGCGKSLTLAHVLHYAYRSGFLLLHVPWVGNWMRRCKERSNSESKEGFSDLNLDAAAWLVHFKTQNARLLSNPDLKTTEEHVWSKREGYTDWCSFDSTNRTRYQQDQVCFVLHSGAMRGD
ncbi:hypothetical protein NQ315_006470 [Exocentrus adspersus]|uniref:Small ribosomal subunit protein mS29 n=1 Tax=Exocentrus adspersus TaxID=1586481 RepID=A0AAV8W1L8_9CUCU|nr:hypothetical protein NQ315_006470 [Exocentrus adspersus]